MLLRLTIACIGKSVGKIFNDDCSYNFNMEENETTDAMHCNGI